MIYHDELIKKLIWHVGGEDVYMRIPLLLTINKWGVNVGAVGTESSPAFSNVLIPFFRYEMKRGLAPFCDQKSVRQLIKLFKEHRPDIVHAFDTKPGFIVPAAAEKAGVKGVIRTVTGMGYVFSSNSPFALVLRPFYRHVQRRASASSTFTVFQNSDDMAYFRENKMVPEHKAVLIPSSGIDLEQNKIGESDGDTVNKLRWELALDGKTVVIMISRLVRTKGVIEFFKAARIVSAAVKNVKFLLVGPIASEGRQAVSQKEIEKYSDVVTYLGRRSDVKELLALADIFVLPSFYREGVPRVLLEAAAAGLPLVTTGMPGCRDVVENGQNGLLVPPRDYSALAEAIKKLVLDASARLAMGKKSRVTVKRFDLKIVAESYIKLYRQILETI